VKAIGYRTRGSADVLVDLNVAKPVAAARDLLVAVKAVSVNPVDYKTRTVEAPPAGEAKILGWDVAGVVVDVGPDVRIFHRGDEVFYVGAMNRPGANSEFHVVDERIAGPKPRTLSFEEAAALPLTSITAWEILFDRMRVERAKEGTLLVIAAAAASVLSSSSSRGSSRASRLWAPHRARSRRTTPLRWAPTTSSITADRSWRQCGRSGYPAPIMSLL